jgi:hypothetical protein
VRVIGHRPGQAEVQQLHPPAVRGLQPDVGRLDIAVDETALVGRLQPERDLPPQAQNLGDGRLAAALEPAVQRQTFEEFHREERHAAVLADLVDGDDMVALHGGGGLGLAQEAAVGGLVGGQFRFHDLERDFPFQAEVLGQEDDAHTAAAQHLEHTVPAEPADFARPQRRRQEVVHLLRGLRAPRRRPGRWRSVGGGSRHPCFRHGWGRRSPQPLDQRIDRRIRRPVRPAPLGGHRLHQRVLRLEGVQHADAALALFAVAGQALDLIGRHAPHGELLQDLSVGTGRRRP